MRRKNHDLSVCMPHPERKFFPRSSLLISHDEEPHICFWCIYTPLMMERQDAGDLVLLVVYVHPDYFSARSFDFSGQVRKQPVAYGFHHGKREPGSSTRVPRNLSGEPTNLLGKIPVTPQHCSRDLRLQIVDSFGKPKKERSTTFTILLGHNAAPWLIKNSRRRKKRLNNN